MSKENFKVFVRERPNLIDYVTRKEMTWQEFYNLYELYGPDHDIWNKYSNTSNNQSIKSNSTFSLKDMFGMLGNIDMNEFQKGIGSLQKGIGYLQDFIGEKSSSDNGVRKPSYEPRPIHKYFDD